ncbi:hypothetical protein C8R44DRAFT_975465 [Mycena epipterygia]|nr:hypothetical protein C8R44DRAFT_975465 [Mycena epipterygia]
MAAQQFIETKYAASFPKSKNAPEILVVTCMDPRLKTNEDGIIRNAGGSAEAVISSIVIAQHFIGVTEIAAIHYTDCGRERFTTEGLRETAKKANPGRDDVCCDGRWGRRSPDGCTTTKPARYRRLV